MSMNLHRVFSINSSSDVGLLDKVEIENSREAVGNCLPWTNPLLSLNERFEKKELFKFSLRYTPNCLAVAGSSYNGLNTPSGKDLCREMSFSPYVRLSEKREDTWVTTKHVANPMHEGERKLPDGFTDDNSRWGSWRLNSEDVFALHCFHGYQNIKQCLKPVPRGEKAPPMELPKVNVWNSPSIRIDTKIPDVYWKRQLSGLKSRAGSGKMGIYELACPKKMTEAIFRATFWGRYVMRTIKELSQSLRQGKGIKMREEERQLLYLRTYRERILRFLSGKSDFTLAKREMKARVGPPSLRKRFDCLIEVLKSTQGLFLQNWATRPDQLWTWTDHNKFVVVTINALLGDIFQRGINPEQIRKSKTVYGTLKKLRKAIFSEEIGEQVVTPTSKQITRKLPRIFGYFVRHSRYWKKITSSARDPKDLGRKRTPGAKHWLARYWESLFLEKIELLTQNRGMGLPPSIMKDQSIMNFIDLVTKEPPPITSMGKAFIGLGMDQLCLNLGKRHFTNIEFNAKFTIKPRGEFLVNGEHMGKLEAFRQVYNDGLPLVNGRSDYAHVYDLNTGRKLKIIYRENSEKDLVYFAFWRAVGFCVERFQDLSLYDVRLMVMNDPGKSRTITM
jgi:hypothetical protein